MKLNIFKSIPVPLELSSKIFAFLIIFILSFLILKLVKNIFIRVYKAKILTTKRPYTEVILNVIENIKSYFIISISFFMASVYANFSSEADKFIFKIFVVIFFIQTSQLLNIVINFLINDYLKSKSKQDNEFASTVGLLGIAIKFLVFSVVILLVLNNLGVDVTSLIAGLGVGGVAAALALQNILSDLFSSLTIILDKPFIVGDFIMVNDLLGTVEHIGIKTTRVRSLSGEQLIFGNSDLLQSRIKNYKRMQERRVVQSLTVIYQTDLSLLEQIPGLIKEIVEKHNGIKFGRCHLLRFLDSALEFELVYFVLDPDYDVYADIAQSINFNIIKEFTSKKIEFAYPTQTVFIEKTH